MLAVDGLSWKQGQVAIAIAMKAHALYGKHPPSSSIAFRIVVVVGMQNKWVRRKIELAELAEEPWTVPAPDTLIGSLVAGAFRGCGSE